jgi:hypothetical protein
MPEHHTKLLQLESRSLSWSGNFTIRVGSLVPRNQSCSWEIKKDQLFQFDILVINNNFIGSAKNTIVWIPWLVGLFQLKPIDPIPCSWRYSIQSIVIRFESRNAKKLHDHVHHHQSRAWFFGPFRCSITQFVTILVHELQTFHRHSHRRIVCTRSRPRSDSSNMIRWHGWGVFQ